AFDQSNLSAGPCGLALPEVRDGSLAPASQTFQRRLQANTCDRDSLALPRSALRDSKSPHRHTHESSEAGRYSWRRRRAFSVSYDQECTIEKQSAILATRTDVSR